VRRVTDKLVVVSVNGGPLACEWTARHASAWLEAWEPGMSGGTAVAEIVYGQVNPSGKLPITVPRSVGHQRSAYHHRPAAFHRSRFRFAASEPLFEFGHGLSYSRLEYRALGASERLARGDALAVEVELENASARAGDEIVLVYLSDVLASVTRPVRRLVAFRRVSLAPGERARVRLELPPEAFALLDRKLEPVIEPGEFVLRVGPLARSVWVE
jgi:beta-glucosidase